MRVACLAGNACFNFSHIVNKLMQASNPDSVLVAIHDSARPLVTKADVRRCLHDGLEVGCRMFACITIERNAKHHTI